MIKKITNNFIAIKIDSLQNNNISTCHRNFIFFTIVATFSATKQDWNIYVLITNKQKNKNKNKNRKTNPNKRGGKKSVRERGGKDWLSYQNPKPK